MHLVLRISEILHIIFSNFHIPEDRSNLSRIICVCKTWFTPACAVLWAELIELGPLLSILGTMEAGPKGWVRSNHQTWQILTLCPVLCQYSYSGAMESILSILVQGPASKTRGLAAALLGTWHLQRGQSAII